MKRKVLIILPILIPIILLAVWYSSSTNLSSRLLPDQDNFDTAIALAVIPEKVKGPDLDLPLYNQSYTLGPSKSYRNLVVYTIEGEGQLDAKKYLTLSAALEKNMVKVHETGNVQELRCDNLSEDYVFIHAGDIVKGGRQDRTVRFDVILPPKSNGIPLSSFCVESGRWSGRHGESTAQFSASNRTLASKKLKIASKYNQNQSKVWKEVGKTQDKLNKTLSEMKGEEVEVRSNASASSLDLALENEELKKAKEQMLKTMDGLKNTSDKIVGYAYVINGKLYGVDFYNNTPLLKELWHKLMDAVVVEALADTESSTFNPLNPQEIQKLLAGISSKDQKNSNEVNSETKLLTYGNEQELAMLFSTIDLGENNWLHHNFIQADSTDFK